MNRRVAIIDYGIGNLHSVFTAIEHLGSDWRIVKDADDLNNAEPIILPGVGSFFAGMQNLRARGFAEKLPKFLADPTNRILGICLGFQLLGDFGYEDGGSSGLGMIKGSVVKFEAQTGLRVPHVGFNSVKHENRGKLFSNLGEFNDFYFVHSYRFDDRPREGLEVFCDYGSKFLAAYELDNIHGTQFHPEKSQTNGLRLLHNYIMKA